MTIWANKFKIFQIVIFSIFIFMMHLQYFLFIIPTNFTFASSRLQKPDFQSSLIFDFTSSCTRQIFKPCPVDVGTTSATCFFVQTR